MRAASLLTLLLAVSCNGTTGYDLVQFYAAASGPTDAVKGQPYTFDAGEGRVTLTRATLHVGALYLSQAAPTSGGGPAPCTPPGTYDGVFVGEVRGGGDVDLLDPSPQELSVTGDGTTVPPATGQVWLMQDDVNNPDQGTILTVEGSFQSGGRTQTFSGAMSIDGSRLAPPKATDPLPGNAQICKLRIVSDIPVHVTLAQGGTLLLRVDPKRLFNAVPLSTLPACQGGATQLCFTNDESNEASTSLFDNLKGTGPYTFAWLPSAP
jgi:hypothetical protein